MADKFRKVIPIKITFVDGEAPTSAKLNSLSNQIRSGVTLLEKGLGDLWNQSGDSVLNSTPLQIPNLARLVGEIKYLNPIIFPLKEQFVFRDHIGLKFAGKTEGYLTFVPTGTITQVTGTAFTTSVANEHLVDSASEFWFDTNTGRFRTNIALTTEIIEYTVDLDASNVQHYEQVLPSLIPDPRQDSFTQLRIEKIGSDFYLHLPPRRPLTLAGTDFSSSAIRPERYPGSDDIGDVVVAQTNEASVIVGGGAGQAGHTARLYWQSNVSALSDEHYRYSFPKEINDILGLLAAGTELPAGFMYLWNTSTNTIVEDAKFFIADGTHTGKKWVLKVSSSSLDLDTVDTADELEASYSSGLVLICPGASITRSLWQLASSFYSHKHDKSINSDPAIVHRSLKELNPPKNLSSNEHFGRYPTYLGVWGPSRWNADEHNSLLSRVGTQTTDVANRKRDEFNNAMLGHLLLANADTSGVENYLASSLPDGSFKIFFGDVDGPNIYATLSGIQLDPTGSKKVSIGTLTPKSTLSVAGNLAIGATYAGGTAAPTNGLIVEGNVGIGENSPTEGLNLYNKNILVDHQDGINPAVLKIQHDTLFGDTLAFDISVFATDGIIFRNDGGTGSALPSFTFKTNATTNAVLNSTGLGIGATPVNKLDVEGGVVIGATYSGATTAPTNGLFVEGNVGIGRNTIDSGVRVHIQGASGDVTGTVATGTILAIDNNEECFITIASSNAASKTAGILFADTGASNAGQILYQHDIDTLRFATAQGEKIRILAGAAANSGRLAGPNGGAALDLGNNSSGEFTLRDSAGNVYVQSASGAINISATGIATLSGTAGVTLNPGSGKGVVLPVYTSDPGSPSMGETYIYDSGGTRRIKVWLGAWYYAALV